MIRSSVSNISNNPFPKYNLSDHGTSYNPIRLPDSEPLKIDAAVVMRDMRLNPAKYFSYKYEVKNADIPVQQKVSQKVAEFNEVVNIRKKKNNIENALDSIAEPLKEASKVKKKDVVEALSALKIKN